MLRIIHKISPIKSSLSWAYD